jgi:hypothetical protein
MIRYVTLLALSVFALGAWAQSSQETKEREVFKKPSKHSGLAVVADLQDALNQKDANRELREKRYSHPDLHVRIVDPGPTVNGETESVQMRFVDGVVIRNTPDPDPHGIPASWAHAVVVGTVLGGKVFVNKDRTYIYTDYQIKIDQVLKQDAASSLSIGTEIVGAREGGAIHFPSGHTTHYITSGKGFPEVGSQYVFFLYRLIPNSPDYEILAGYQLQGGQVHPLDAENSDYDDINATAFLDTVQKAIAGGKP